jgi:hypothetical protein
MNWGTSDLRRSHFEAYLCCIFAMIYGYYIDNRKRICHSVKAVSQS